MLSDLAPLELEILSTDAERPSGFPEAYAGHEELGNTGVEMRLLVAVVRSKGLPGEGLTARLAEKSGHGVGAAFGSVVAVSAEELGWGYWVSSGRRHFG